MIPCERARRLMAAAQVDQLRPGEHRLLAEHLRSCAACSAEAAGWSRLSSHLASLLAALPDSQPSADLDDRIVAAALADRERRRARPHWLGGLVGEIARGTVRTTGTLVATVVVVAILGAAFVFAAAQWFSTPAPPQAGVVESPVVSTPPATSSREPSAAPSVAPSVTATSAPIGVLAPTPRRSVAPARPSPSPAPSPSPQITPGPTPTPLATAAPSPSPEETPAPSPTVKRRTPPPSPSPSSTESPLPSATESPSPTGSSTPSP